MSALQADTLTCGSDIRPPRGDAAVIPLHPRSGARGDMLVDRVPLVGVQHAKGIRAQQFAIMFVHQATSVLGPLIADRMARRA